MIFRETMETTICVDILEYLHGEQVFIMIVLELGGLNWLSIIPLNLRYICIHLIYLIYLGWFVALFPFIS